MLRSGTVAAIATAAATGILSAGFMVFPDLFPENCRDGSLSVAEITKLTDSALSSVEPWMTMQDTNVFRPWTFIWSQKENPLDSSSLDF